MSFVVIEKATGEVICEIMDDSKRKYLNTEKYEAIEIGKYLCQLNLKLNNGLTYRDKVDKGLLP